MPLSRKLQEVVADLSVMEDPQERLAFIIDRAKSLPELPPDRRTEAHRVPGCVSIVWLAGEVRGGRCYYLCAAESPLVRGLVAFVADFFSGFTPSELATTDVDPLESLGITRNLSPTRRNGLVATRRAIRAFAGEQVEQQAIRDAGAGTRDAGSAMRDPDQAAAGASPFMLLFDAHNHLQDAWLKPHRAQVFADLAREPIAAAVVNGTAESDWDDVTALASEHPFIRPAYGLHPWNVGNASPAWREHLVARFAAEPRASVGEVGLDRWILDRARPDDPRLTGLRRAPLAEQVEAFTWQLRFAAERNVPATVHCLDAWGVLNETLRATPRPPRGFLLHAYGGSISLMHELAKLGAYFSFNGYFLGARQSGKRAVFEAVPLDRLLVETDAPAMPLPASRRTHELPGLADGNPINHPANLRAVYAGLAEIRGLPVEELAAQVAENFRRLFG